MNLFNSVKTQKVSKKTHAPLTLEVVTLPDGKKALQEQSNEPLIGSAEDFSVKNQMKTGVKLDAPQKPFFKSSRLNQSDIIRESAYVLDGVSVDEPIQVDEPTQVDEPKES